MGGKLEQLSVFLVHKLRAQCRALPAENLSTYARPGRTSAWGAADTNTARLSGSASAPCGCGITSVVPCHAAQRQGCTRPAQFKHVNRSEAQK